MKRESPERENGIACWGGDCQSSSPQNDLLQASFCLKKLGESPGELQPSTLHIKSCHIALFISMFLPDWRQQLAQITSYTKSVNLSGPYYSKMSEVLSPPRKKYAAGPLPASRVKTLVAARHCGVHEYSVLWIPHPFLVLLTWYGTSCNWLPSFGLPMIQGEFLHICRWDRRIDFDD